MLVILIAALSAATSWSMPRKYVSCMQDAPKVRAPKNSGGYFFNKSCDTIYVLPPKVSKVSVDKTAFSVSPAVCEIISIQQQSMLDQAKDIRHLNTRYKTLMKQATEDSPSHTTLKKKCTKLEDKKPEVSSAIARLRKEVENQNKELEKAKTKHDTCQGITGNDCFLEESQVRRVERKLARIEKKLVRAETAFTEIESRITLCKARMAEKEAEKKELRKSANLVSVQRDGLEDDLDEAITAHLEKYGRLEGATTQIMFENTQHDLVEEFKRKNPGLTVVAMPVQMGLTGNVKVNGNESVLPALISSEIPGIRSTGWMELDEEVVREQEDPSEGADSIIFGNSLGGQVRLTMSAACPLAQAARFKPNRVDGSMLSAHLVANAQFSYHVQVDRKYRLKHRLGELAKQIRKRSKRNGFFRTSATDSLISNKFSKEWISIHIESQDPANQFKNPDELRDEIKKEYFDRVMKKITASYVTNDTELQEPNPKNGAGEASRGLKKCPHLYCQVAGIVLNVGNAIWGGTDAVAKFIQNHQTWQDEEFVHKKAVTEYGSMGFASRN